MSFTQFSWPAGLGMRSFAAEDLAFLARLYASSREAEMAQSGWPQEEIDQFLLMQHGFQHQYYLAHFTQAHFDIIVRQGRDIGRLYWEWRDQTLAIIDIVLLPEYRGQGIGAALLKTMMDEAVRQEKGVSLYVEYYNPAQALYLRLGFVEIGSNGVYRHLEWRASQLEAQSV